MDGDVTPEIEAVTVAEVVDNKLAPGGAVRRRLDPRGLLGGFLATIRLTIRHATVEQSLCKI
jgi:hypothetical protein